MAGPGIEGEIGDGSGSGRAGQRAQGLGVRGLVELGLEVAVGSSVSWAGLGAPDGA